MPTNYKTGDLPDNFVASYRQTPDIALIRADNNLARPDVIDQIQAAVGMELESVNGALTLGGLAQLYLFVSDNSTRTVPGLKHEFTRPQLLERVAAELEADIDIGEDQDSFKKHQQLQVWFDLLDPAALEGADEEQDADADPDAVAIEAGD